MVTTWLVLRGRSIEAGPYASRAEALAWVAGQGTVDVLWRLQLRVRPA